MNGGYEVRATPYQCIFQSTICSAIHENCRTSRSFAIYAMRASPRLRSIHEGTQYRVDPAEFYWFFYNISLSFDVYAAAFTVRNGASGQYGIYPTLGSGTAPGANYKGIGIGMLAGFN